MPITKRIQISCRADMTSLKQIEANRRNALKSTGPRTKDGKQQSSQNAVRHGLTAERSSYRFRIPRTTKHSNSLLQRTTTRNPQSSVN
jgi:hypothetical protein